MGLVMYRFLVAAVAVFVAITFAQIASAADLPVKAPVVAAAPVYNWTGFYVGANIGGGWGNHDVDGYTPNDPAMVSWFTAFGPPPSLSLNSSGVIGGFQLGYNWQFNRNWLVGLETDFDGSGVKGSTSTVANLLGSTVPATTTADERLKWFGTVRARLGYLPADNILAYVTGGFAYGRVERNGSYSNSSGGVFLASVPPFLFTCGPGQTCLAGSSNDTATGWTVGGGIEYAVWQRWTVRAEYLYLSLGAKSVTETALFFPGSLPASFNANFKTNINVARVGLNYRF